MDDVADAFNRVGDDLAGVILLPQLSVPDEPFLVNGATCERIDLDSIDSVLLGDNNAMYELKNANYDVRVKIKTK